MSIDHYENFPVASVLCPPRLRPAVKAIYWFARTADDIADEGSAKPAERLQALEAYRSELRAVAAGAVPSARWKNVFAALQPVLFQERLPLPLLEDLLSAFKQDVHQQAYEDRAELLDYCRRSANPIGRLLLHLYGITGCREIQRSDDICTALQLANFWQDLGVDAQRGRVYAPRADCERHRVPRNGLLACHDTAATRALVAELVGWTRELMVAGAPLVHALPGRTGWELRLVVQGGMRILEKIERMNFATLTQRPVLNWHDGPSLLWRAVQMRVSSGPLREARP